MRQGFDHKFINENNPSFRAVPPTAENIARQLYIDVAPLFSDDVTTLVACHLTESPSEARPFIRMARWRRIIGSRFSAARKTMSAELSVEENARLFWSPLRSTGIIIALD